MSLALYEFHFEGLSNFSPLVEELAQIQDANPRIYIEMKYKTLNKCVHELYDTCFHYGVKN